MLLLAISIILFGAQESWGTDTVVVDSILKHVPAGEVVKVQIKTPGGEGDKSMILDGENRIGRSEGLERPGVGSTITLFDDDGHTTLSPFRLRLSKSGANFDSLLNEADRLLGMTMARIGKETVNGGPATVLATALSGPEGTTLSVRALTDEATGLRVREEWTSSGETMVISRQAVLRSAAISELLDPSSLEDTRVALVESRKSTLDTLGYAVFGLDEGTSFSLKNIVPGPNWTSVRLEYSSAEDPGRLVAVVSSWDLAQVSDYPARLLKQQDQAVYETSDAGSRLSWVEGETAIQLQLYPNSAQTPHELARELVVVNRP
jgi:hypothetical protein